MDSWCFAYIICSYVIGQILSADLRESIVENIHSKLTEVGEKVMKNEVPLEMYEINKVSVDPQKGQVINSGSMFFS